MCMCVCVCHLQLQGWSCRLQARCKYVCMYVFRMYSVCTLYVLRMYMQRAGRKVGIETSTNVVIVKESEHKRSILRYETKGTYMNVYA